jgi:hypothetical protein|tara:strand:+ start:313 stop:918 length:606 start_codon:yes stop_codon:yes gene_type:complete
MQLQPQPSQPPQRKSPFRIAESRPFLPQVPTQLRQPPQSHFHYYNSAPTTTVPNGTPLSTLDERESLIHRGGYNRQTSVMNTPEARKCWNVIQWTMVAIVLAFIVVGVVLMSLVFDKMSDLMHMMDAGDMMATISDALSHAHAVTSNMEAATQNVVDMTATAKSSLDASAPVLLKAVNESGDAVHSLSTFSSHPSISIGVG